jgi:hypothetical protein
MAAGEMVMAAAEREVATWAVEELAVLGWAAAEMEAGKMAMAVGMVAVMASVEVVALTEVEKTADVKVEVEKEAAVMAVAAVAASAVAMAAVAMAAGVMVAGVTAAAMVVMAVTVSAMAAAMAMPPKKSRRCMKSIRQTIGDRRQRRQMSTYYRPDHSGEIPQSKTVC